MQLQISSGISTNQVYYALSSIEIGWFFNVLNIPENVIKVKMIKVKKGIPSIILI